MGPWKICLSKEPGIVLPRDHMMCVCALRLMCSVLEGNEICLLTECSRT